MPSGTELEVLKTAAAKGRETTALAVAWEKARISGKKKMKDRRVVALEEAGRDLPKQKEERTQEELGLEAERRIGALGVDFIQIGLEGYVKVKDTDHREQEATGWIQYPIAEVSYKEVSPEMKRNLSAASIWVFARKLMATEWARALGRKLPDPRAFALEREAKIWQERREEERRKLHREKEMLESFCQLLSHEGKFNQAKKERWDFGGVGFLITKVGNGWNVCVEALGKSPYMRRKGWNELLGIYSIQVDSNFNMRSYSREGT